MMWSDEGSGRSQGTEVYDADLQFLGQLDTGHGHADLCIDAAGHEVLVGYGPGGIRAWRLDDQSSSLVLAAGSGGHVSCRNLDRPGWAYVSFTGDDPDVAGQDQVFAVKLDGSEDVQVFGSVHRSASQTYETQPHAVPSRDGSSVLWASDWHDQGGKTYAYVGRAICD